MSNTNQSDETLESMLEDVDAMVRQYAGFIERLADTTAHVIATLRAADESVSSADAKQAVQTLVAQAPDLDAVAAPSTSSAANGDPVIVSIVQQNAVSMQQMLNVLAQAVTNECVAQVYAIDPKPQTPPGKGAQKTTRTARQSNASKTKKSGASAPLL